MIDGTDQSKTNDGTFSSDQARIHENIEDALHRRSTGEEVLIFFCYAIRRSSFKTAKYKLSTYPDVFHKR